MSGISFPIFAEGSWKDLAFSSKPEFLLIQYVYLTVASAFWMRRLIDTRIGGVEAIEIRSWPRLILGTALCNMINLLMHHLFLKYGPSTESSFKFMGLHFLTEAIVSMFIICTLGIAFDSGKAIWVRTDRFKPVTKPGLIDMTQDHGRVAQIIPRGAIFAYQFLMLFTWIAILAVQRS